MYDDKALTVMDFIHFIRLDMLVWTGVEYKIETGKLVK